MEVAEAVVEAVVVGVELEERQQQQETRQKKHPRQQSAHSVKRLKRLSLDLSQPNSKIKPDPKLKWKKHRDKMILIPLLILLLSAISQLY